MGNSDGHTLDTIGDGRTYFPGSTAEDYRQAIREGTTSGGCADWGFVREAFIYTRQVRKQARDVTRWGRRNILGDDLPRDLGVAHDQLALQRRREEEYFSRRGGHHQAAGAESPEAEEPSA